MRLLGNTALLEPLADTQVSAGGLLLVNKHKKPTLKFRVLAVGPGAWRFRKGRRKCFIVPEVAPGDLVLCRAQLDNDVVKESFDDGTGRIIVHADKILCSWREA